MQTMPPMLKAVTKLLGDHVENVVQAGCLVFQNLTLSIDGALLCINHEPVMRALTGMLTERPLSMVAEPTLRLLLEILNNVSRIDIGARAISQLFVVEPALLVVKKFALYDPETVFHAVAMLWNVATHVRSLVLWCPPSSTHILTNMRDA